MSKTLKNKSEGDIAKQNRMCKRQFAYDVTESPIV